MSLRSAATSHSAIGLLRVQAILAQEAARLGRGAILVRALELALDEGPEPALEQLQSPCRRVRDW